jgi:outer membrane lipoprotein-sorting protein
MPAINRIIKLPPSVMSQGWMGSDYSNDDLVKQSSMVKDYKQNLIGNEKVDEKDCYVIELIPLPETTVVWGKILAWVDKSEYIILKGEYYDEQMELVRTEEVKEVKKFSDRLLPSVIEIVPCGEEGNKTVITFNEMLFDIDITESFFTQQNMKKIR